MPLDATTDSVSRKGLMEHLCKHGDRLFDRSGLLAYWEELRRNFYPERESFTGTSNLGEDWASDLMTSYPLVARRDLGNTFSAMLRRDNWFKVRSSRPDKEDTSAKQWLDGSTSFLRNAMYDSVTGFVRAMREADHDYVTFGQACIQIEMFRPRDGSTPHFLYRNRHLRDVAWLEGVTGQIDTIYRRDKPTAHLLAQMFPGKIHPKVQEKLTGPNADPYAPVNIWHCVMPAAAYAAMPGGKEVRQPWVSVYMDVDNEHELECVGQWTRGYAIPRWQTVSGSQYAHSAAMVAALPDARLLQAVTLVLLMAGEKAVDPPMIATEEVVRSDIATFPGGTTWVSEEYDERLGEALRPMTVDKSGLQFALELVRDIRNSLRDATFLSKLDLPPVGSPDMTAYEVGQRVQESIRNMLPLFEPVEQDYSAWVCDDSFELLWRNSPELQRSIPPSLLGQERKFEFESPLRAAADKAKAGQLLEAQQIIAAAAQGDPSVVLQIDTHKATRDVLHSFVPAGWLRTEQTVEEMIANQQAKAQQERMLALMEQGAGIAKIGSEALANVSQAAPSFQLS